MLYLNNQPSGRCNRGLRGDSICVESCTSSILFGIQGSWTLEDNRLRTAIEGPKKKTIITSEGVLDGTFLAWPWFCWQMGPWKKSDVCKRLEEANFALCKILKAQKAQRRLVRLVRVDCWLGSQTKKLFLTLLVGCKDGHNFCGHDCFMLLLLCPQEGASFGSELDLKVMAECFGPLEALLRDCSLSPHFLPSVVLVFC